MKKNNCKQLGFGSVSLLLAIIGILIATLNLPPNHTFYRFFDHDNSVFAFVLCALAFWLSSNEKYKNDLFAKSARHLVLCFVIIQVVVISIVVIIYLISLIK